MFWVQTHDDYESPVLVAEDIEGIDAAFVAELARTVAAKYMVSFAERSWTTLDGKTRGCAISALRDGSLTQPGHCAIPPVITKAAPNSVGLQRS